LASSFLPKKLGSITMQAVNDDLRVDAVYLQLNGSGAFSGQIGNVLSSLTLRDSADATVATESSRDSTSPGFNDIVKFTSFANDTVIPVGQSRTFDIYGVVGNVNSAASAGEFTITLATSYNDSTYSDEYNGVRLLSVDAGRYVSAGTITANAVLSNNFAIVATFPNVSKVSDGNSTDLLTFRITNPGSTNLTVDQVEYFANAQSGADIAKPFKIFNGGTQLAAGSLVAGASTSIAMSPLTIAGGQSVTLTVKLDSPFVNTATNPAAGQRVFQIQNVRYSQTFSNGTTSAFGFVPAGFTTSVGLPVAAANF
jgi:hypothetical protein